MPDVRFGPFCLDTTASRVVRDGVDLKLRPQAVSVLKALLQKPGQYLDYDQLLKDAWGGIVVSRHTVATTVADVRKALNEYGSWISYRPRVGYCLNIPRSDELIQTGWHLAERRTREGLEKALACFQRASLDDPSDHRAFESIARTHLMLGMYGIRPPRESYDEFLEAQSHAIGLCGLTPELRADRAHALHLFERNVRDAESELLQAEREKPTATIYVRLVLVYTAQQRFDLAERALEQARIIDRFWPTLPANEIFFWYCRRDFKTAIERARHGLDLQPYLHLGRSYFAQALEYSGRTDEAMEQYRIARTLAPDIPWLRALEARCLAILGQRAEAARVLKDLRHCRTTCYVDAYYLVPLLDALGKREDALAELERAIDENSATLYMIGVDPKMDALRSDPRFEELRNSICAGSVEFASKAPRDRL